MFTTGRAFSQIVDGTITGILIFDTWSRATRHTTTLTGFTTSRKSFDNSQRRKQNEN